VFVAGVRDALQRDEVASGDGATRQELSGMHRSFVQ
jgi:hypothetical protein